MEVVKQILACAKFLKDMWTFERKSKDGKSKEVLLSEQVNSILKFDTPPKFKDCGVPLISCYTSGLKFERKLLGDSSVSLIPYSIYLGKGLD